MKLASSLKPEWREMIEISWNFTQQWRKIRLYLIVDRYFGLYQDPMTSRIIDVDIFQKTFVFTFKLRRHRPWTHIGNNMWTGGEKNSKIWTTGVKSGSILNFFELNHILWLPYAFIALCSSSVWHFFNFSHNTSRLEINNDHHTKFHMFGPGTRALFTNCFLNLVFRF